LRGAALAKSKKKKAVKELDPTGVEAIDRLQNLATCSIEDYLQAASAYILTHGTLSKGAKKASQIRLSNALAKALVAELEIHLPGISRSVHVGEKKVSGGLRTVNADVSQSHELDGLRLAVELKPVNLAVGRAIWNRFGDLRTFAVNLHLKFPFSVIGGVLVVPTSEEIGTKAALAAAEKEEVEEEDAAESDSEIVEVDVTVSAADEVQGTARLARKPTVHLIKMAIARLTRAGGRKTEGDAPHLLEAISVVVFDPETGRMDPELPADGSGLRWNEFCASLAAAYKARFED
jgi:hypothetical protein